MDLNSLLESAGALWAVVGASGGLLIMNVLTFVKTSVSGKKFTKVSDFAVVAHQSAEFGKKEMLKAKAEIVEETKKLIVEPLQAQVKALVSDNATLVSAVVSLLSYVPLPLEVKKESIAALSVLGNVSSESKKLLEASVAYQEKQIALEQENTTQLKTDISKI